MNATTHLRNDHQMILLALKLLDHLCSRLEAGQVINEDHLRIVVDFITDYADAYHNEKEENVLIPYLEKAGLPLQGSPVELILDEHILQRGYVEALGDALKRSLTESLNDFTRSARNLIGLLSEHILLEDNFLLLQAEAVFTSAQQEELHQEFLKFEQEHLGAEGWARLCEPLIELRSLYLSDTETNPATLFFSPNAFTEGTKGD